MSVREKIGLVEKNEAIGANFMRWSSRPKKNEEKHFGPV